MSKRKMIESLNEVNRFLNEGETLYTTQDTSISCADDARWEPVWITGPDAGAMVTVRQLFSEIWYIEKPDEPQEPKPPEGVENAVVCPVRWDASAESFVFKTHSDEYSLESALGMGATHFGFPCQEGTTRWSPYLRAWMFRLSSEGYLDVFHPIHTGDPDTTQVHVTHVCISQPKEET